jgi:lipid-binding SYLF domain-containing protein
MTMQRHITSERHTQIVAIAGLAAICALAGSSPQARAIDSRDKMRQEATQQSQKAAKAFDAIMQVPDKAIPRELLEKAKAIAVFPRVVKVALTVGGEGGRGVVSQRQGDGWGRPVFLRAGGGSVGPQIGASSTDFFLLLMNDESVEGLMKDKFELGGEAGVAAGPIGRNAGAATDALMHAEILSYSRSRGLFAGVNVKGIVLKPEDDLNLAVYNKTAQEILREPAAGEATTEFDVSAFPRALRRYTEKP